jgi:hypothetical protein
MQDEKAPRVPLWELKTKSCRWPSGAPSEPAKFFCGKPTTLGSSWCPEHRRRVFTKASTRLFNHVSGTS